MTVPYIMEKSNWYWASPFSLPSLFMTQADTLIIIMLVPFKNRNEAQEIYNHPVHDSHCDALTLTPVVRQLTRKKKSLSPAIKKLWIYQGIDTEPKNVKPVGWKVPCALCCWG